jgi:N-acetylneuraminic acid mutarotase
MPDFSFRGLRAATVYSFRLIIAVSVIFATDSSLLAQVPHLIQYQGRVNVSGTPFEGEGQFKFALVSNDGTETFWSHDETSKEGGEPAGWIGLQVKGGLFSVLLGDKGLNMSPLHSSVFDNADVHLRVWFNDGANGFAQLEPDQRISAVGYAMMAENVADGTITSAKLAPSAVNSGALAAGAVTESKLSVGAAAANLAASGQGIVPSGGLILSATENQDFANAGYIKIGATSLADSWERGSQGPPPGVRTNTSLVWTGSEVLMWGGRSGASVAREGRRFNPAANVWTSMSMWNAPSARAYHTAVWTGSEMIMWGGDDGSRLTNTGARYNPAGDYWLPMTQMGGPSARWAHTAVWTGEEMIVWGGMSSTGEDIPGGALYNPNSDSWVPMSILFSPTGRSGHSAVWTGSEMIIWGGRSGGTPLNNGGRYSPGGNSWQPVSSVNAPAARSLHTAVWTGSEMIVWGGVNATTALGNGGRYTPASDSWASVTTVNAPSARAEHAAVWTGEEMIVMGADAARQGARYRPASNTWLATATTGAPDLSAIRAVWSGRELIAWGTDRGGRYDPQLNQWNLLPGGASAPAGRSDHTAVWTGSELIVWGGRNSTGLLNTGGRYNPAANLWSATSTASAPSARMGHTAVWTGSSMVIWGGDDSLNMLATGARYTPASDTWSPTPASGAPSARGYHTAVWAGNRMIVWGGLTQTGIHLQDGASYEPVFGISWNALPTTGAPAGRSSHTAVWTGTEMVVWGGFGNISTILDSGGRYRLADSTWHLTSRGMGVPSARIGHTAVWTGTEMIIWGGDSTAGTAFNTGARYRPAEDAWYPIPTPSAFEPRYDHIAVWSGQEMLVWGGSSFFPQAGRFSFADGARFNPVTGIWELMSTQGSPPAGARSAGQWIGDRMLLFGGSAQGEYFNDVYQYRPGRKMFLYQKP